ncbi:MAG: helix-hairpin-helix domain-containing protein [Bacteroidales bacterium]|nr:helix-hairpin-helix domain-containing protein [Bacteroidales bacterium]
MKKDKKDKEVPGTVFKAGGIALAFLIIGYQSSLFIHRAAALHIEAMRDRPDTVFVYIPASGDDAPDSSGNASAVRRNAEHSPRVETVRRRTRRVESFRFNPNTVSVEDLMRLGFSEKQAQSIDNYRTKGGRFRRASDFAKSYVVADSVFERLKPFIDIPRLDINKADSSAFDELPGIGPYFAAKMVEYRERLGGYSFKEQLMDIYRFDQEKFDALSDLIVCSKPDRPLRLWQMPEDSLKLHPYIKSWQAAHSIVLFRLNMPEEQWTVQALKEAGILPEEDAGKLARCCIAEVHAPIPTR